LWLLQFSTDLLITKYQKTHGFKGMLGFNQNDLRGAVSGGHMQSTGKNCNQIEDGIGKLSMEITRG
jgi:hypothetical protein